MSIPAWSLIAGILLLGMALAATLLARLSLSNAMVYLGLGFAVGPGGLALVTIDPFMHAGVLERAAEVALLISLFAVGLRTGSAPWRDPRWRLPLKLAVITMTLTVALVALVGVFGLGLPLGAAILLGAILAPTDPVLASGVRSESGSAPDPLRFSLAGEAGLNDGTAFPFAVLGLGLLGVHEPASAVWRWLAFDVAWATVGGLGTGMALGALVGASVVHLRTRHGVAVGLDEFLSLGLVATAYGASRLGGASGFLAVFGAGVALQQVRERPREGATALDRPLDPQGHDYEVLAVHSHHASAVMSDAVHGFNEQLEKVMEMAVVLLVGVLLSYVTPSTGLWWFAPLLLIVLRPLAVWSTTGGEALGTGRTVLIGWFGIRGIGSVFYLMFAIDHGLDVGLANELLSIVLVTVSLSIVVHGMSLPPLMRWYASSDRFRAA